LRDIAVGNAGSVYTGFVVCTGHGDAGFVSHVRRALAVDAYLTFQALDFTAELIATRTAATGRQ
jgi:hypothetical protein